MFASRRFSSQEIVAQRILKHLLDNAEIIQSMVTDQADDDENKAKKIDQKEENKVISYIQALSQVVMNIVSGNTSNPDECYRLIAATMSVFSEYLLTSTLKIKSAATQALRLIITHGLIKLQLSASDFQQGTGFQKVYLNLKYLISSRFQESKSMQASL